MAGEKRSLICSFLLIPERPQKAEVLSIGSMGHIKNIADDRYGTQDQVYQNVPAHLEDQAERRALTHGSEDKAERNCTRRQVTDTGNQADQCVQAEPDVGARNAEGAVEPEFQCIETGCPFAQNRAPLALYSVGRFTARPH